MHKAPKGQKNLSNLAVCENFLRSLPGVSGSGSLRAEELEGHELPVLLSYRYPLAWIEDREWVVINHRAEGEHGGRAFSAATEGHRVALRQALTSSGYQRQKDDGEGVELWRKEVDF